MLDDLRYALRVLLKTPGFTAAALIVLALGIGANTTVFTFINALSLRPLPVGSPHELVYFRSPSFSYPIYEHVKEKGQGIFSNVAAWTIDDYIVNWNGERESTEVLTASGNFYSMLGVGAARGRTFSVEDDRPSGGPGGPVAVITDACWEKRFGRDPSIVGKSIRIDRALFTIVGITPRGFYGVAPGRAPEITIPITVMASPENLTATTSAWVHLLARLKPGVTRDAADAAVQTWWPQVMEATTNPGMPADRKARYLARKTGLQSASTGYSSIRNRFMEPLSLVWGLVGLLLLVGCATVANLLLARAAAKRREVAVRLALGAGRLRIVRQFFMESLVLGGAGAVGGLLIAAWAAPALLAMLSTSAEPMFLDLQLDARTAWFTAALALATAVVFGSVPSIGATRLDPGPSLKDSRQAGDRAAGGRLGKAVVAVQVAMSLLLLTGATLFARSLYLILSADPGFDRANVIVIIMDPLSTGREGERLSAFYSQMQDELRSIPGVASASLSYVPPVSDELGSWTQAVGVDGAPVQQGVNTTYFNAVSEGYFRTLGIQRLRGRDFTPDDRDGAPRVAIINESLASAYFPNQDPLGHRISIGRNAARRDVEIVGVVRDSKYQKLQEATRRIAYFPYRQTPEFIAGSNLLAEIRVTSATEPILDLVRRKARAIEPALPIRFDTLTHRIQESLVPERLLALISGFLGLMAVVLACCGLYGVMAYTIVRRTREIGVRMALGASRPAVLWMVLKETIWLAGAGVAAGAVASLALGRFAATYLYGLTPSDPVAVVGAAVSMMGISLLAGYLPARRAATIEPVAALSRE